MRKQIGKFILSAAVLVLTLGVAGVVIVYIQARATPAGRPEYVALGSSFAAGAGLGRLEPGSPTLCARSVEGYPHRLARSRRLSLVDMSCGGAVTRHLTSGGQFFQGPQLRTVTRQTRLVTITVGGNDVGYVADLSMLAARRTNTVFGRLVRVFWKGPRAEADRRYEVFRADLLGAVRAVRRMAPDATIVLATYPAILPGSGTCDAIGLTVAEATTMRGIGNRLAALTRSVARQGGAVLVDMNAAGAGHDACAAAPWTSGWKNAAISPFHPTVSGAEATAAAISAAIGRSRPGDAGKRDR